MDYLSNTVQNNKYVVIFIFIYEWQSVRVCQNPNNAGFQPVFVRVLKLHHICKDNSELLLKAYANKYVFFYFKSSLLFKVNS